MVLSQLSIFLRSRYTNVHIVSCCQLHYLPLIDWMPFMRHRKLVLFELNKLSMRKMLDWWKLMFLYWYFAMQGLSGCKADVENRWLELIHFLCRIWWNPQYYWTRSSVIFHRWLIHEFYNFWDIRRRGL